MKMLIFIHDHHQRLHMIQLVQLLFQLFLWSQHQLFKLQCPSQYHVDPSYFSLQSWIVLVKTWQVSNLVPFWYPFCLIMPMSLSLLWSLLPCYNCDLHLENCYNVNEPIGIPIKYCFTTTAISLVCDYNYCVTIMLPIFWSLLNYIKYFNLVGIWILKYGANFLTGICN